MRKNLSHYRNYVCPECFEQLNVCRCNFMPHSLIMIDEGVQECVRELNKKNYRTSGCCEGHFRGVCRDLYISFGIEYNVFDNLPDGFYYNEKRRMIIYVYNAENQADFEVEKIIAAEKLTEWVKSL